MAPNPRHLLSALDGTFAHRGCRVMCWKQLFFPLCIELALSARQGSLFCLWKKVIKGTSCWRRDPDSDIRFLFSTHSDKPSWGSVQQTRGSFLAGSSLFFARFRSKSSLWQVLGALVGKGIRFGGGKFIHTVNSVSLGNNSYACGKNTELRVKRNGFKSPLCHLISSVVLGKLFNLQKEASAL